MLLLHILEANQGRLKKTKMPHVTKINKLFFILCFFYFVVFIYGCTGSMVPFIIYVFSLLCLLSVFSAEDT